MAGAVPGEIKMETITTNFTIRRFGTVQGTKAPLQTYSADTPSGRHLAQIVPMFDGFRYRDDKLNVLHADGKVEKADDLEHASDLIADKMKGGAA